MYELNHVLPGLLVAVIDHEHVKLRLLYSRKKKLDKTVENLRNEVDELKVGVMFREAHGTVYISTQIIWTLCHGINRRHYYHGLWF